MGCGGEVPCSPLSIPCLFKKISVCLDIFNKTQECTYKADYEELLKQGRYHLVSTISLLKEAATVPSSAPTKDDVEREIFLTNVAVEMEETKIGHLRKEWSHQLQTMGKLQESFYKKCRMLSLHSHYCASQGKSLCAILAMVMEDKNLVKSFLDAGTTYVVNFIKIADGCLLAFVKTYREEIPSVDSSDYQYIMTLFKCVSMLCSLKDGKQYVVTLKEGHNLIAELVYVMPYLEHAVTKGLRNLLLKILSDIASEDKGVNVLARLEELPATLNFCMGKEYDPVWYKQTLEITERVSRNLTNQEILDHFSTTIDSQRLMELSVDAYKDVCHIPKRVFRNIRQTADKFRREAEMEALKQTKSEDVQVCECKSLIPARDNKVHRKRSAPPQICKQCDQMKTKLSKMERVVDSTSSFHSKSSTTSVDSARQPERSTSTLCKTSCQYLFNTPSKQTRASNTSSHTKIKIRVKTPPPKRPLSEGQSRSVVVKTSSLISGSNRTVVVTTSSHVSVLRKNTSSQTTKKGCACSTGAKRRPKSAPVNTASKIPVPVFHTSARKRKVFVSRLETGNLSLPASQERTATREESPSFYAEKKNGKPTSMPTFKTYGGRKPCKCISGTKTKTSRASVKNKSFQPSLESSPTQIESFLSCFSTMPTTPEPELAEEAASDVTPKQAFSEEDLEYFANRVATLQREPWEKSFRCAAKRGGTENGQETAKPSYETAKTEQISYASYECTIIKPATLPYDSSSVDTATRASSSTPCAVIIGSSLPSTPGATSCQNPSLCPSGEEEIHSSDLSTSLVPWQLERKVVAVTTTTKQQRAVCATKNVIRVVCKLDQRSTGKVMKIKIPIMKIARSFHKASQECSQQTMELPNRF